MTVEYGNACHVGASLGLAGPYFHQVEAVVDDGTSTVTWARPPGVSPVTLKFTRPIGSVSPGIRSAGSSTGASDSRFTAFPSDVAWKVTHSPLSVGKGSSRRIARRTGGRGRGFDDIGDAISVPVGLHGGLARIGVNAEV